MNTAALIRIHVNAVRNRFLKEGGHRHAHALYLVGGFARDEGTCAIRDGRLFIYNDMDFLVLLRDNAPHRLLAMLNLQRRINDGRFPCPVDLVIESRKRLTNAAPTIQNYDMQEAHTWLWGERFYESGAARKLDRGAVSVSDALQLLLNRQASLLIGFMEWYQGGGRPEYLQVQFCKPLLAMMSATLIAESLYAVPVRRQLDLVEAERGRRQGLLWDMFQSDRLRALLHDAVRFKHTPDPGLFEPFEETLETIAACYQEFIRRFMLHAYALPPDCPANEVLDVFQRRQPARLQVLGPAWWACRLRSGGAANPRPGFGPHPQVDVYVRQAKWLNRHTGAVAADGSGRRPRAPDPTAVRELQSLIHAWKVSGYGCHIV